MSAVLLRDLGSMPVEDLAPVIAHVAVSFALLMFCSCVFAVIAVRVADGLGERIGRLLGTWIQRRRSRCRM